MQWRNLGENDGNGKQKWRGEALCWRRCVKRNSKKEKISQYLDLNEKKEERDKETSSRCRSQERKKKHDVWLFEERDSKRMET